MKAPKTTVAARFIDLFENHGIHRNQIPRFLGEQLTLAQISDDDKLLDALTEDTLAHVASSFALRREWLDGADDQIYRPHDFYKHPERFAAWIDALAHGPTAAEGVVLVANTSEHEIDALLIFEERFAWIGDKPIYRYHICNNWMHSYWKSRAYLTACVAMSWAREVWLSGRVVDIEAIRRYRDGRAFFPRSHDSALPMSGHWWYPEDMSLRPEAFLENLDEGAFGRRRGLALWLDLDAEGYMNAELPGTPLARSKFEAALDALDADGASEEH